MSWSESLVELFDRDASLNTERLAVVYHDGHHPKQTMTYAQLLTAVHIVRSFAI